MKKYFSHLLLYPFFCLITSAALWYKVWVTLHLNYSYSTEIKLNIRHASSWNRTWPYFLSFYISPCFFFFLFRGNSLSNFYHLQFLLYHLIDQNQTNANKDNNFTHSINLKHQFVFYEKQVLKSTARQQIT